MAQTFFSLAFVQFSNVFTDRILASSGLKSDFASQKLAAVIGKYFEALFSAERIFWNTKSEETR